MILPVSYTHLPKGKKTVAEMSTTLTKHERVLEMAKTTKAMIDALQLTDLSKTESRTCLLYTSRCV